MRSCCGLLVLFALLAVANGQIAQCNNSLAPYYIKASDVKCDLDLRSQCGCGSWCGIAGPKTTDDQAVKCVPLIDTPDAPPPKDQGGNPCLLQDCPAQPFTVVKCPNGTTPHSYVGASCNKVGSACVWQLPYCDPVFPPHGARCTHGDAGCPSPKPTTPPGGELNIINCGGWWAGTQAHYDCIENGIGGCMWQWVPCPANNTCPIGMESGLYSSLNCDSAGTSACQWQQGGCANCDPYPASCPAPNLVNFTPDFCGGCNCHVTLKTTGADVCQNATWIQPSTNGNQGIMCKSNYTYSPNFPYCVPIAPTPTCANFRCGVDQTCFEVLSIVDAVYSQYVPSCYPTPRVPNPLTVPCSNVYCAPGYNCVTDPQSGQWSCVWNPSKTCTAGVDCTTATKTVCWDGSLVGGPGCTLSHSGQCVWDFQACPDFNVPATNGSSTKNCQVSAWTSWTCGAPCGQWGKLTRVRDITQNATARGVPCPNLLDVGADCQGTAPGCASLPGGTGVISEFTTGTMPTSTYATGVATSTPTSTGGSSGSSTPTSSASTTAGGGSTTSTTPTSGTPTSGTPTSGTPTSGTPTSGTPTSGTPTSGTPATSGTPTSGTTPGSTGSPVSGASGLLGSLALWVCTILAITFF